MEIKNLWIGDEVRLIKSQRVGKVVKIDNNAKIVVSVGTSKVTTHAGNLELFRHEPKQKFQDIDEWLANNEKPSIEKNVKIKKHVAGNFIDLHLDKLDTQGKIILEQNILEFKMNTFTTWFENTYKKRYATMTVVHGKGTGTLKSVLESWLKSDHRVQFIKSINDDGALEIWLKYS